jgi:hypothetical protein
MDLRQVLAIPGLESVRAEGGQLLAGELRFSEQSSDIDSEKLARELLELRDCGGEEAYRAGIFVSSEVDKRSSDLDDTLQERSGWNGADVPEVLPRLMRFEEEAIVELPDTGKQDRTALNELFFGKQALVAWPGWFSHAPIVQRPVRNRRDGSFGQAGGMGQTTIYNEATHVAGP